MTGLLPAGFPHSDISGSTLFGRSPELLAAVHVLLRLHKPRHPPYALAYFFSLVFLIPSRKGIWKTGATRASLLLVLTSVSKNSSSGNYGPDPADSFGRNRVFPVLYSAADGSAVSRRDPYRTAE